MNLEKCRELSQVFDRYYPCPHSNLRIKMGKSKIHSFIEKAEGSRIWDVDGNEFIDYMSAMGPNILGHRHPEYVKAIKTFMDEKSPVMGSGAFCDENDIILAEKLVKHIPCAEKVKLSVTGSDAVQMVIRLSRAYTNRPYFIRFEAQYHGWPDNVLGGALSTTFGEKPFPVYDLNDFEASIKISGGMSQGSQKESFILPWNNLEVLEETLNNWGDEIALIHFEAVICNDFCLIPYPGFLEKVRDLCIRYGIVMSFDEVITGFRLGLSGAQGYFGVTPDIATFGKAMAGGLPVSAVVGKSEIMNQFETGDVLGPGTFNGFPLGIQGAITTLNIMEANNGAVYDKLDKLQTMLTDGLMESAQRNSVPLFVQGVTGVFYTIFGVQHEGILYHKHELVGFDFSSMAFFSKEMKKRGIIVMADGRWHLSIAHTEADIQQTLERAEEIFKIMK